MFIGIIKIWFVLLCFIGLVFFFGGGGDMMGGFGVVLGGGGGFGSSGLDMIVMV